MQNPEPERAFRQRNTARAQALRRAATPFERMLWQHVSRGALGVRFSRQLPVGPYFADFLCRELKLIVELDGFSHDVRPDHDTARDRWLTERGYRVLRFTNAEVRANIEGVVRAIAEAVREERARSGA